MFKKTSFLYLILILFPMTGVAEFAESNGSGARTPSPSEIANNPKNCESMVNAIKVQFSEGTGTVLKEIGKADSIQGDRRPLLNCITARTAYCKGLEHRHMATQYGCNLGSSEAVLKSGMETAYQVFNKFACDYGSMTLDQTEGEIKNGSVTPDCKYYGFK